MNSNQYCVILAGGSANKFWPVTRDDCPKQFIDLLGTGVTLLQAAYRRCQGVVPDENIIVVTTTKYEELVREQIPQMPYENCLAEPYGRHTAPCIALSTYKIIKRNPEAVMAVIPSDLFILEEEMFRDSLRSALDYAQQNPVLVSLGIVPCRPDPNFGYIQVAGGKAARASMTPSKVKTFTEKPDCELAKVFMESQEFFWNTGIFVWQADVIREEMECFVPEITSLFKGWETSLDTEDERKFIEKAYVDISNLSIDYGVMEKTDKAWVFPVSFKWSDIDSWQSLHQDMAYHDNDGNATNCKRPYFEDNKNSIIVSKNPDRLVAICGLENFIVIDTEDVLLICPKDDKRYKDFVARTAMPGYNDFK